MPLSMRCCLGLASYAVCRWLNGSGQVGSAMKEIKTGSTAIIALVVAASILTEGCRSKNSTSSVEENTEPAQFTVSPIEIDRITDLEPLGWMNPVGHTFPTDHVYFYVAWVPGQPTPDSIPVLPVYAPGDGVVIWLYTYSFPPYSSKVSFRMNKWVTYYLDHVILDTAIGIGSRVTAGQLVGVSEGASIDLGVVSDLVTLPGFVNPKRYEGQTLHTDSPFKYFTEPLRSQLYGLVRRNAPDKDGKIDYDVKGKLIGNWFHESVTVAESMGPSAWPKELAFCPDGNEPTEMRISIGGTVCPPGKYKPSPADPSFAQVSVASGRVSYHLNFMEQGYYGIMLVQLIDETRMKVEVFPNSSDNDAQFTPNALIYSR